MKLIIDISIEDYNNIKTHNGFNGVSLARMVEKGTPLPKGHGRCIDANEITAFRELECNGHNVKNLDEFTTIIEADKESEE